MGMMSSRRRDRKRISTTDDTTNVLAGQAGVASVPGCTWLSGSDENLHSLRNANPEASDARPPTRSADTAASCRDDDRWPPGIVAQALKHPSMKHPTSIQDMEASLANWPSPTLSTRPSSGQ